jgi:hypothetical protein
LIHLALYFLRCLVTEFSAIRCKTVVEIVVFS